MTLEDHRDESARIRGSAGKRLVITIETTDSTAVDFKSLRWKVSSGGSEGVVRNRGLAPGRGEFIAGCRPDTAKGVVIGE